MKKCPYCKTLSDDKEKICPHCLHDISLLKPMPNVNFGNSTGSFYGVIFGLIFLFGGLIAGVNQLDLSKHYLELSKNIELSEEEIKELIRLAKDASTNAIFMFLVSVIGIFILVLSIIWMIKRRNSNKKSEN